MISLPLLALLASTDVPVVSIRPSGWEVPGIPALYSNYEPTARAVVAYSRWTVQAGGQMILATEDRFATEKPFWVTTVVLDDGRVRPIEEVSVPYSAIGYALPNEKPYSFRIVATPFDLKSSLDPVRTYVIYDHDGDGVFEEIEQVASLQSDAARAWVPRPKLVGDQARPPRLADGHFVPVLSDRGWYVLGRAEMEISKNVEASWELVAGDVRVRAESVSLKGYDDGWTIAARSTTRGVSVSHVRSRTAGHGTRYTGPDGRVFCLRVSVHPFSLEGIAGGLWDWAFYDLDGDGTFELVESGAGTQNEKEWMPRLPPKAKARR